MLLLFLIKLDSVLSYGPSHSSLKLGNTQIDMAESKSTVVVALNSSNYPTWKVQRRMALMKDGLWNIVYSTERPPPSSEAEQHAKFMARRDHALAIIIVLSVEPSLLYYPVRACAARGYVIGRGVYIYIYI